MLDIPLSNLCRTVTPPCRLNPFLFNGHLQTAYTAIKEEGPPIIYKRKIFNAEDPDFAGTFAVDFVVHDASKEQDDSLPPRTTYYSDDEFAEIRSLDSKPMLISLHGLSGGSHEIYLRHVLAPLVTEEAGWAALVVNSRGCAMSKITTGILYNARATWDVRQVVKWCREAFPNRPLFGIGYSLGANILTNRTWLGSEVYSKTMGNNMKKLFETHVDQICKNPRINVERVRSVKYLHEFDRELQGPTWGYPTEGAYYRDASSADSLLAIQIPLFALHAEDDPIAVKEAIPYEEFEQNPYTVLCTTTTGGHLSWFESGGQRWFARPAVNFLQKMAKEIDFEATNKRLLLRNANGSAMPDADAQKTPFVFEPMRRKLHIPS
ncbi:hypothetical protein LTR04_006012 [Oleoguttula sp. CCFEE 6159]|nr:hypothetical protein LTR04_006012 [Oleoguttula sp. CCFEE 6159]